MSEDLEPILASYLVRVHYRGDGNIVTPTILELETAIELALEQDMLQKGVEDFAVNASAERTDI